MEFLEPDLWKHVIYRLGVTSLLFIRENQISGELQGERVKFMKIFSRGLGSNSNTFISLFSFIVGVRRLKLICDDYTVA